MKHKIKTGTSAALTAVIGFVLLLASVPAFAQSINKSQYTEIDLFSYLVEKDQIGSAYTVKYRMALRFNSQSGTTVYFSDAAGDLLTLHTTQRWTLSRGQAVYIYFTARHLSTGLWTDQELVHLETGAAAAAAQNASALIASGYAHYERKDWDRAIADYTQAIRLDPDFADAYFWRAAAYDEKSDWDRAIDDYTQAIRLDPNDKYAYNRRGRTYGNKGNYNNAIDDYTQAIRLDPNFASAYNNRGNTYYATSDYDSAIADYTQAIRLDPNVAVYYSNRGLAYDEKGDYDSAIADYSQAIRLDPNNADYYNYRVTGNFAGWTSNYEARFMMTPVALSDPRLQAIQTQLKDAEYVYIYEYTPDRNSPAGWNVEYPGAGIRVDGIYAVKLIRLKPDSTERSGWAYDMWMPSTEAGGLKNLSPDTMYMPLDRSPQVAEAAGDGLGNFNDNPVVLKGAVPYYIVFAVFKDKTRGMGAVLK
jgi:tetratricopeptide (TPR) repeat protein